MRVLNCDKRYQTPLSSGGCIIERRDGMNYHLTPRGFIIIYIYEGILEFLSFNMPMVFEGHCPLCGATIHCLDILGGWAFPQHKVVYKYMSIKNLR